MRLLMIAPTLAVPPNRGDKARIFNILKGLSTSHQITLATLVRDDSEFDHLDDIYSYCERVETVQGGRTTIGKGLLNILSLSPYHTTAFRSSRMSKLVESLAAETRPDVVYCNFLDMSQFVPLTTAAKVLDQVRLDRDHWAYVARFAGNPLVRLVARVNLWKVKRYERLRTPLFDLCFCVSEADRQETAQFLPPSVRLAVAPNGVDIGYFQPAPPIVKEEANTVMICGGMNQRATVDAVLYFYDQVWPWIRHYQPDARLWLVGRQPVKSIQRLAVDPMITVTGTVSDVRPYLHRASVCVAPFRQGGGTKLKILDTMATGKAIVSTTTGCLGIDVTDGVNVLVQDAPRSFADAVVQLLNDPEQRERLGRNARRLVETTYSWSQIISNMVKEINRVVSAK